MERVKQRIIETIIQINRTHTLPAYGLLLVGPAGTGKSQIAYAVARILKLPWTTLDMSSINDPEQLTGSSRVYANAKPGIIMEAFSMAGESNLVFIINELDKAASGKGNGNPADVLLTLLDNLGFTDNYMECMVPTVWCLSYCHSQRQSTDQCTVNVPFCGDRYSGLYSRRKEDHLFPICASESSETHEPERRKNVFVTDEALDAVFQRYSEF